LASKPEKYSHALKALAIREHKIYIAGKPNLNINGNLVFLDVEGNSSSDFYYLIGMRVKNEDSYVQHSFWANEKSDEKDIWNSFLDVLAKINNPQLIYYGHYEKVFFKEDERTLLKKSRWRTFDR
jgi:predicted RecB family nuclease